MNPTLQTLDTFTCHGLRSVRAESLRSAAEIFANREARKAYGRRGYARTCNMSSYASDLSFAEFSAFIGTKSGQHETTGHNINFTVHRT